jgi:hypothetical protein
MFSLHKTFLYTKLVGFLPVMENKFVVYKNHTHLPVAKMVMSRQIGLSATEALHITLRIDICINH